MNSIESRGKTGAGNFKDPEEKFRILYETLTDAVVVFGTDRFVDANPAALRMFGFARKEDFCSKHPSDLSPAFQPNGEDSRALAETIVCRCRAEGTITFPWLHQRTDRSTFSAEVTATPVIIEAAPVLLCVVRDVTAQKKAHDDLVKERTLLRTLIDNIPDAVYVKDTLCRKFIANSTDVRNTGKRTEAEILGKDDFDLFPPDMAAAFYHDDQQVLRTGEPVINREESFTDSEGRIQWLLTSKIALRDDSNTIIGLVGIGHNITTRKLADLALKESEQRYRDIIEQSADGIYIMDVESRRIVQANKSFHQLLGYTAEEVLELTVYDIIAASVQSIDERITRIAHLREIVTGERLYKQKTGGIIPVRISVNPITFNGRSALCTMMNDITVQKRREEELRTSEERFRLISENVADCIISFTTTGDCLYASPSLIKLGYDASLLQGEHIFTKVHPEDLARVKEEIEAVQWSMAHRPTEFRFRRQDGSWVTVEATISLLIDDAGSKILMVMRDITERKQNEAELHRVLDSVKRKNEEIERTVQRLKQMQSGLVQSEKLASIGQLTAGIAHEINNPLAFVSSNLNRFAEYYQEIRTHLRAWQDFGAIAREQAGLRPALDVLEEEGVRLDLDFIDRDFTELMKHTIEGSSRIKRIVDQLRGFSHMATNDFTMADINQTLDETLTLVWNEIKYKTTIHKEYGSLPEIPCSIGEIKQVFVNLLVNAAHAIPEKGEITLRTVLASGAIRVMITDTGMGMTQDTIKRIFDPFYTTKPVGKGTGLGLWIVTTIMEKHHGAISVESEVGVGTTFTLTLPLEQEEAERQS